MNKRLPAAVAGIRSKLFACSRRVGGVWSQFEMVILIYYLIISLFINWILSGGSREGQSPFKQRVRLGQLLFIFNIIEKFHITWSTLAKGTRKGSAVLHLHKRVEFQLLLEHPNSCNSKILLGIRRVENTWYGNGGMRKWEWSARTFGLLLGWLLGFSMQSVGCCWTYLCYVPDFYLVEQCFEPLLVHQII